MKTKEEILDECGVRIFGAQQTRILEAMESYAKQKLQQHGVMQAEGSDSVSGAAVGQRSGGTVAARGHIHKWHKTSAKEMICYMCGETQITDAGSSYEEQP
jgi:hypothetical protein